MNAPHSKVCSVALTPTALRFDWMTVDIATGDCTPEPDSGTQSVVEKPFGRPASASSFRARAGSCGYGLRPASAPHVPGSTGPADMEPVPLSTSRTIASLLTA